MRDENVNQNMATLAKGTVANTIGALTRGVVLFLQSLVFARMLGIDLFGTYQIAVAIYQVLLLLGQQGLGQAIVRFVAEYESLGEHDWVRSVLVRALHVGLGSSIFIGCSLFFGADWIARTFFNPEIEPILRFFGFSLPFAVASELLASFSQAHRIMRIKVAVQDIFRPMAELLIGAALVSAGWSLAGLGASYFIAALIGIGFLSHNATQLMKIVHQRTAKKIAFGPIMSFSTPLLFADLFRLGAVRLNVVIVGTYLTASAAGAFSVALLTVNVGLLLITSISFVFGPIASALIHGKQFAQLEFLLKATSRWLLALSLPAVILISYLSQSLLDLFGDGFRTAAAAMVILALGQLLNIIVGNCGLLISMSNRTWLTMVNSIVTFLLKVGLMIWLIPKMGLVGAALAESITVGVINLLRLFEVQWILNITPLHTSQLKAFAAAGISGLISGGVHIILAPISSYLRLGSVSLCFIAGYVLLMASFGLEKGDAEVLKLMLQRLQTWKRVTA